MKLLAINAFNFGSTGNIAITLAQQAEQYRIAIPYCSNNLQSSKNTRQTIYIGNRLGRNIHRALCYITGLHGAFSILDTLLFLRKITQFQPDIIHLHNLHSCYINLPLLFAYLKKHHIPTVWTLHDCWAFTGQCPYFTFSQCDKWKTGCHHCPQIHRYPPTKVDNTKTEWKLKRKWFSGVPNMTLVTPSNWLATLVEQSYLQQYPVQIIHNGINLSIFKPAPSGFRTQHNLQQKTILLGVANNWDARKGIDTFTKLASALDSHYKIVLVGTTPDLDKQLPSTILSIHNTRNQAELAQIYTAADIFINPTLEENYPTVNMESIACGTPVITFPTGGSPEILTPATGTVLSNTALNTLINEIHRISNLRPYTKEHCLAHAQNFDFAHCLRQYAELYRQITPKN